MFQNHLSAAWIPTPAARAGSGPCILGRRGLVRAWQFSAGALQVSPRGRGRQTDRQRETASGGGGRECKRVWEELRGRGQWPKEQETSQVDAGQVALSPCKPRRRCGCGDFSAVPCCRRQRSAGSLPPPRGVGGGAGSWLGFLLFSSSATADEIFVNRWAPDQLFSADLVHQSRVPTRACCCRGQGPRAAVLATMGVRIMSAGPGSRESEMALVPREPTTAFARRGAAEWGWRLAYTCS